MAALPGWKGPEIWQARDVVLSCDVYKDGHAWRTGKAYMGSEGSTGITVHFLVLIVVQWLVSVNTFVCRKYTLKNWRWLASGSQWTSSWFRKMLFALHLDVSYEIVSKLFKCVRKSNWDKWKALQVHNHLHASCLRLWMNLGSWICQTMSLRKSQREKQDPMLYKGSVQILRWNNPPLCPSGI